MKLMYRAYFMAIFVPNVPIKNQQTTANKLKQANPNGLTCASTP